MKVRIALLFALVALLPSACDQHALVTEPHSGEVLEQTMSGSIAQNATLGDSTLTFWISGPLKMTNPGIAKYVIRDLNGTGPYLVRWYVDRCFAEGDCHYSLGAGSGWMPDTLKFYADANLVQYTISAQIVDANGYTGGGKIHHPALGPWGFGGSMNFSFCDGTANWYPFSGHYPGTGTPGNYYRNACDGSRVWDN